MKSHGQKPIPPAGRLLPIWLACTALPLLVLPAVRAVQASSDDLVLVAAASVAVAVLALTWIVVTFRGPLTCAPTRVALRRSLLRLSAGVVVLALLPLAGLAYLSVRENTSTVSSEVARRLASGADVSVAHVNDRMEGLQDLITSYADRRLLVEAMRSGSSAEVERHLAELRSRNAAFAGTWALDASGAMLAVSPSQPAIIGWNFTTHDYVRGVLQSGRPHVSEAFAAAMPGNPHVVAVAVPVKNGGRTVGVLVGGYQVQALSAFVDRFARLQQMRLKLTDQRGILLAGTGSGGSTLVSGTEDEHVRAALAGAGGSDQAVENGIGLMTAYRPVPSLGWAVVTEVPTDEAYAEADQFTGRILAVTLSLAQVLLAGLVLVACAERRRHIAEAILAHREDQVSSILEAASDAFIAVDGAGRVIRWNSQAEAIFGWPVHEALGKPLIDLTVPDEQREAHRRTFARLQAGDGPHLLGRRIEVEASRRDGTLFPAEMTVWTSSAGDEVTFSAFVRDITERKHHEVELAVARDEALTASRMKSEFVANMSHEIRTPMNGVIGLTTLLLDTELDVRQRDYLTTVQNSADALLNVINDILDFSKIEAGKLEIDPVDFDVRALVEDVVSLMAAPAQAKRLEITAVVHPAIPPALRGDVHRIRQVLTNMVSNAIKFTERGEVIVEVAVGAPEGHSMIRQVHFAVVDTGIGIPADRQASLFDAFTQADASTTRHYGGTGLGLTISRQLVELMGGTIGLISREGVGSRFHFTLPLPDATAPLPASPSTTDLAGRRVLVVDDNRTNRTVVQDLLTTWGMRAHTAPDARTALTMLRQAAEAGDPFTVALLDMHMPDLDGLQLAQAITASPGFGDIRLAMLTSTNQVGEAQAARECGIEAYLTKPVRAAQLRAGLLQLLGKAPTTAPAASNGALAPEAGSSPSPLGDRAMNGMRILVAEDNEVNQQVAAEMLASLGYDADIAGDGEEALLMLETDHYDAVLMDCQMPRLDGFQATERIRRLPAPLNSIPIIALTASALASDEQRCRDAGMDAFLSKPLRRQQLDAFLRTALPDRNGGTGPARPETLRPAAVAERSGGAEPPAPGTAAGRPGDSEDLLHPGVLAELRELGPAFIERILPSYLSNTAAAAADIVTAAGSGDLQEVARLAHKLRGSSGSFAGRRLSATCAALEKAASAGDAGNAAALAGAVAHQADATIRALRTALVAGQSG
ncbi:response regulator [Planomonospora sp. ID67723]|uniref:response regulator n=1 Tax=Planomonospora sp. ID67723 TaxID=2738134 RepID=UPI0018C40719|nr:response regulator [Planomonospora sp. ID67723]MBG0827113.1 response regulator [Planomonospora sp. ID67723]